MDVGKKVSEGQVAIMLIWGLWSYQGETLEVTEDHREFSISLGMIDDVGHFSLRVPRRSRSSRE